jgi:hypothetical protein
MTMPDLIPHSFLLEFIYKSLLLGPFVLLFLWMGFDILNDIFMFRLRCHDCKKKKWRYDLHKAHKWEGYGATFYDAECRSCHQKNYNPTAEFIKKHGGV